MSASALFAAVVSDRIRTNDHDLAQRWLSRLEAILPLQPSSIFPTPDLLDHVPELIREIASFLAVPDDDIAANTFVLSKARELGILRHTQRASAHQLLREYELLRGILHTFVIEEIETLHPQPTAADVLRVVRKIDHAIGVLTEVTVDTFIQRYTETIGDQTRRLEQFNRLISHELRQPLGVLHLAAHMIKAPVFAEDAQRREQTVEAIARNVTRLGELLDTITRVTQSSASARAAAAPGVQRIQVTQIAGEAARQLRELAQSRDVDVRIAEDLPELTVDVGQLDLMLTNLLSNGVKYHDPDKRERFVEISRVPSDRGCAIAVTDNGLGMSADEVAQVFKPFWRGHPAASEGIGLGMAIVRDCANAIGATIGVESVAGAGTTFTIAFPASACAVTEP